MKRMFAALSLGLTAVATSAQAATIVDTGPGVIAPASGAVVGVQAGTFGEFEVKKTFRARSIEFFGITLIGGTAQFGLYFDGRDGPGLVRSLAFKVLAASPVGSTGSWQGVFGLSENGESGIRLESGTYWVGLFSDGVFSARHLGGAPRPLGNEATGPLLTGVTSADGLDLGWRISDQDVMTAVPEPATWAMMLIGFALTGSALRRRRLVPASA